MNGGVVPNIRTDVGHGRNRNTVVGNGIAKVRQVGRLYQLEKWREWVRNMDRMDGILTSKGYNMTFCRGKRSTHGDLVGIFRNTESIVISVGLQVTNEILRGNVGNHGTSLN